jgi:hypothetical protein
MTRSKARTAHTAGIPTLAKHAKFDNSDEQQKERRIAEGLADEKSQTNSLEVKDYS